MNVIRQPWFSQSSCECGALAGGNIRVGLEDNIWLEKGVLATNGQLVERAKAVAEGMGARILGPNEVHERMKLTKGS